MSVTIAINGFGRIGRLVFREMNRRGGFDVVALNDLTDARTLAHLLKYDSVHGRYQGEVTSETDRIVVDGKKIPVFAERNPKDLPWNEYGVDFVVEATGVFRTREKLALHLEAGAKKVILTVPAKGEIDATIVLGVNNGDLKADHRIISNASCTTNCIAPMAKVLNDNFGIVHGLMNTIHGYTNDQRLLDLPHSDLRRGRSAALSAIPTTTGAAKAVGLVIPELQGKMDGFAVRIPIPDGSMIDLSANLERDVTVDEINAAFRKAAENEMKGILKYCEDPIVSVDVIGDNHSCTFDSLLTMVLGDRFIKVIGWYDNEFGYSCRVVDLIQTSFGL